MTTEEVVADSATPELKQKVETLMSKIAESGQHVKVDLKDILIDKGQNVRLASSYTQDSVDEMAAQIESVGGLLQPIVLARNTPTAENGMKKYIVIMGHRRSLGLSQLAETDPKWGVGINAILIDAHSNGEVRTLQLLENMARKDLSPLEKAIGMKEALSDEAAKKQGINRGSLARMLGISAAMVTQHLDLLRFPGEIKEHINSGELSLSNARCLIYNVPEAKWMDMLPIALREGKEKFESTCKRLYGGAPTGEAKGDETLPGKAEASEGIQRSRKLVSPKDLTESYIPFVANKAKEASVDTERKYTEADIWNARLDALKTVTLEGTTALATAIKPYLESIDKKEEAEKAKKEAEKNEEKFWVARDKAIREILNAPIDEANPDQARPTLSVALATVAKSIVQKIASGDFTEEKLGFKIPGDSKAIVEKLGANYSRITKEKRERAEKARKTKEEKEAAEKAKADAEAAALAAKMAPVSDESQS